MTFPEIVKTTLWDIIDGDVPLTFFFFCKKSR